MVHELRSLSSRAGQHAELDLHLPRLVLARGRLPTPSLVAQEEAPAGRRLGLGVWPARLRGGGPARPLPAWPRLHPTWSCSCKTVTHRAGGCPETGPGAIRTRPGFRRRLGTDVVSTQPSCACESV